MCYDGTSFTEVLGSRQLTRRIPVDIDKLKRMVANRDFRATSVKASLGNDDASWNAIVTVTNDRKVLELEATGRAATMFALRLHGSRNKRGLPGLRPYRTTSDYWLETMDLAKDYDQKLREALRQLTLGRLQFDYDPTALICEFLRSGQWHETKFMRLKRDYFAIQAFTIAQVKEAQANQQRMFQNKPGTRAYTERIDAVLNLAYGSAHEPVDTYLRFQRSMPEDSSASVVRAWHEYKLVEDLRKRLAIQGTIPGEIGIRYLMDNYRRLSEALVPFIRVVSDGVCILGGRPPLQATTGFTRRCNAIKDSEYADLLGCFDPAIRASESHAGTEVDKETGTVVLTDRSTGVRRVIGEYKFEQIAEMTHDLMENLFPAFLGAIYLHEVSLLLLSMRSQAYLDLLLCVGNLEHESSQ